MLFCLFDSSLPRLGEAYICLFQNAFQIFHQPFLIQNIILGHPECQVCHFTLPGFTMVVWQVYNNEYRDNGSWHSCRSKPPAVMTDGTQFSCGQSAGSWLTLHQLLLQHRKHCSSHLLLRMGGKGFQVNYHTASAWQPGFVSLESKHFLLKCLHELNKIWQ